MKRLVKPNNQILNLRSQELSASEIRDPKTKDLINNMQIVAGQYKIGTKTKAKPKLVGLAAVQIGVPKRVILVCINAQSNKLVKNPEFKFFFNPRIIDASINTNLWKEGCFSTGDIAGLVRRSDRVRVVALDENGKEFEYDSPSNFVSRIIQHEVDHLDGVRFPCRVTKQEYLHIVEKNDREAYKKGWRNWEKKCSIENWLKMYNGRE